jgi:hypothetical protein
MQVRRMWLIKSERRWHVAVAIRYKSEDVDLDIFWIFRELVHALSVCLLNRRCTYVSACCML